MDVFDPKYKELFMPDGVEFIYSVLQSLNYRHFDSKQARNDGIEALKQLFELDVIDFFRYANGHENMESKLQTVGEKVAYISGVWFSGADLCDFYSMPMFIHKKWYLDSLEKAGFTPYTYWEDFYNHKIRDMRKWIDDYRPESN